MTVKVSKAALNLREELADLRKPSGIAGEALLRADSVQEQRDLIGAGRKNLIINGDFQVSQRGDYTTATAADGYQLDRWNSALFGGASGTIQHKPDQTLPNGVVTNSLRLTITSAASTNYALWQWIEGYKQFRGQTTTLSFWYKSSADQALNYYNYVTQTHVDVPNSNGVWAKFSHTHTWGTTGTTNTRIEFFPYGKTLADDDYIEIAQFQLELGSVATEFDNSLSYGEQLALCQRYFYQWRSGNGGMILDGWDGSNNAIYHNKEFRFPVEMRSTPSANSGGSWVTSNVESSSVRWQARNSQGAYIQVRNTSSGRTYIYSSGGTAWTNFDAEIY